MAPIVAKVGLLALRGILKLKPSFPRFTGVLLPYACQVSNSTLLTITNPCLQEKILRETLLVPNERAEDLNLWNNDNPTRAWLRKWWLTKNYRGTQPYHNAASILYDETFLPTLHVTKKMFKMENWKVGSQGNRNCDEIRRIKIIQQIDQKNGHMNSFSLLEILEAAGGAIDKRGYFNAWCESHNCFEFLTQDYINQLASYLKSISQQQQRDKKHKEKQEEVDNQNPLIDNQFSKSLVVLELGAGNGRLSYFLRKHLLSSKSSKNKNRKTVTIDIIAIDNGGWNIRKISSQIGKEANVNKLDFKKALEKYQPDIVIVSWMPMNEDWTAAIRATPSVKEYILIGETDDGCCGDNWATWGNPKFAPNSPTPLLTDESTNQSMVAPFTQDNWDRKNLDRLSQLQISRFDCEEYIGNSSTVSFVRN